MVILQFNKFIRNKWAWGAVAVLFCVMFVGSDIVANLAGGSGPVAGAGRLGGEEVEFSEFNAFVSDERINARNSVETKSSAEINRAAWEACAAVRTAEAAGIEITDARLAQAIEGMFAAQGGFDFQRYSMMLQMNLGLTPEAFEAYLRRQMTVRDGIDRTMLGTAVWASPMEVDQLVADMTDVFTVRVAGFRQDKAAADAVKLDEAGLKKWYDANTNSIALPDRVKIRFVKFDATRPDVLARMTVTEDDMRDYYDANGDKYPSADTNDVDGVKKFDVVKGEIEKELRRIEAVNFFETNLNLRVYGDEGTFEKGKSRLEAIAAAEKLPVQTSGWFSLDGRHVEGFMIRSSAVLPGARNLLEVVAELDPSVEDLRYGIVTSDRAVWLVEKTGTSPAHLPTFAESRGKIDAAALRDAKADAFRREVEAIAAKGVDAVLATKDVTTNLTFVVTDLKPNTFKDQMSVVRAATKLKKGGISGFTLTGTGRAILVVCGDRIPGDAAKAVMMRSQLRDQAAFAQQRDIAAKWQPWNLDRLALETTPATAIVSETDEDADSAEAAE